MFWLTEDGAIGDVINIMYNFESNDIVEGYDINAFLKGINSQANSKEVLNEQYEKYTLDTFCLIKNISDNSNIYIGQPDMGLSDFGL